MGQICDLETVEAQEISIKVCVMYYNIEICYRGCGKKKGIFLADLLMVEGLFILLFECESGINHYARQKTLTDVLVASLITCYYLRSVALEVLYCHTI